MQDVIIESLNDESLDFSKDSRFEPVDYETKNQLLNLLSAYCLLEKGANQTYRIEFPKGLAGSLMNYNGGFTTSIIGENGKITGTAKLIPANNVLIGQCLNGLAIVTCQYYLSQISDKLMIIENKLSKVLEFLYDDKACEIYAEVKCVSDIAHNFDSIMRHNEQRVSYLSEIIRAKNIAEKNIQFYYRDMFKTASILELRQTKRNTDYLNTIYDDLNNYKQSISLYSACSLLEILLSQNFESSYITSVSQILQKRSVEHGNLIHKLNGQVSMLKNARHGLIDRPDERVLDNLLEKMNLILDEKSPVSQYANLIEGMNLSFNKSLEYRIDSNQNVYKLLS